MTGTGEGEKGQIARTREYLGYALVVGAIWLGWEMAKSPFVDRLPPATALRLSPSSPEVLRRAAEIELQAERYDNASALADESLLRAPFNARALRTRGLAEARLGNAPRADEILTLAGNWSLRDDPAHAWLLEYRLRRGDYGSSFAHADTLARRRPDLYPTMFGFFTTAALQDPRSMPNLAALLRARPPWRQEYFNYLLDSDTGAPVIGGLAIALEPTDGRFTVAELKQLYRQWISERRYGGIHEIRRRLNRPSLSELLINGEFDTPVEDQLLPLGWTLGAGAGISTEVLEDDLRPDNQALRIQYDGFAVGAPLQQFTMLEPGAYTVTGESRTETLQPDSRLEWRVVCPESDQLLPTEYSAPRQSAEWQTFSLRFTVPGQGCSTQWLQLRTRSGDRRTDIVLWIDKVRASRETRSVEETR